MAFPVCVSAQDDDTDDEVETVVRTIKKKQKQYTTRVVRQERFLWTAHPWCHRQR